MMILSPITDLFTESAVFVNINSLIMLTVFIIQSIVSTWVTNKLNIKDVEVSEVDTKVTDTQGNIRVLSGAVYEMSKAINMIGKMSAEAYMASNLDHKVKMELAKHWVEIEKVFQAVTISLSDYVDTLTDDGIEKIKAKNELLGQALDLAKDSSSEVLSEMIRDTPSFLEKLINQNKT